MPTVGYVKRNGVPTGELNIKLGDRFLPLSFLPEDARAYRPNFSFPKYENALSSGLRQHVRRGDRIVVVGGGRGVTSTIAASQTGSKGYVWVFEGSKKRVSIARATLEINDVDENTEVQHAIVGKGIAVQGDETQESPPHVDPNNLPECEVMELDCEGAEVTILENMQAEPRTILVECHGMYGASTNQVKEILQEKGYKIKNVKVAERRLKKFCKENDIRVVIATKVK